MSRIGFDEKIHPYELQLRTSSLMDPGGLRNRDCLILNLREGRVTQYNTDKFQINTAIREYVASDDELKELYCFFTFDAIERFENMAYSEISRYEIGYYDFASLQYLILGENGRISDGRRTRVWSIDPIEMAIEWMHNTAPSVFQD